MRTLAILTGLACVTGMARADELKARFEAEYNLITQRSVAANEPLIVAVGGAQVQHDPGYAIWSVPSYQGDGTPRAIVTMPIAGFVRVVGTIPGRVIERPAIFPLLRRWSDNRRWMYDPPKAVVQVQPPTRQVVIPAPQPPQHIFGIVAPAPTIPQQNAGFCACGANCPCKGSVAYPARNNAPNGVLLPHLTFSSAAQAAAGRPFLIVVGEGLQEKVGKTLGREYQICYLPIYTKDNGGKEDRVILVVSDRDGGKWVVARWYDCPSSGMVADAVRYGRQAVSGVTKAPTAPGTSGMELCAD
jgi:hypothetical protein